MSDERQNAKNSFFAGLRTPVEFARTPEFRDGWILQGEPNPTSHLTYVDFSGSAWSDDLEELHEESSRDHFIDRLTRDSLVDAVAAGVPNEGVVVDLGCSTGYLLEDLSRAFPHAHLAGVDVIAAGLRKAHAEVPAAALLLADACDLPIGDATVDAVVSANMLEHIADDVQALREVRRILVPGGTAAFVVPFGDKLYDYYDRFLGHERRYATGELAKKVHRAGLELVEVNHLGQLLYPPFWFVKKRNRRTREHLRDEALQAQVAQDIATTTNSRLGTIACRIERSMGRRGIRLPFGIRELVVVRKPRV